MASFCGFAPAMAFNGSARAAQPDMRFPIASIAQMFIATLFMQLVEDGRISSIVWSFGERSTL